MVKKRMLFQLPFSFEPFSWFVSSQGQRFCMIIKEHNCVENTRPDTILIGFQFTISSSLSPSSPFSVQRFKGPVYLHRIQISLKQHW